MHRQSHPRTHALLAAVLSAVLVLPAQAQKGAGPSSALSAAGAQPTATPIGPMPATTDVLFDVAGIFSWEGPGSPLNEVRTLNIGANARVVGIGWDVTLFADAPSWLEEMVLGFGSTTTSLLNLTPGVGDDFSGTKSYTSGGVVDLVGLGLDFNVLANGTLRMEFFESFNDFVNDWDGRWERGTVTIRVAPSVVVPEPSTYVLLVTGLAAVLVAARRRRA